MLRRTESIVEKMLTNWLALAMYDYMRDYAGSSLFVLFKAIKFQVSVVSVGRWAEIFLCPLNALEIIPWVFHKHFVFRQSAHHVRINKLCFTVLKPGPGRAEALRANATENIHSYRKPCRRCPDPVPAQHYLIVEMYKKSQRESCQNIFVLKWIISQCNSDSRVEQRACRRTRVSGCSVRVFDSFALNRFYISTPPCNYRNWNIHILHLLGFIHNLCWIRESNVKFHSLESRSNQNSNLFLSC